MGLGKTKNLLKIDLYAGPSRTRVLFFENPENTRGIGVFFTYPFFPLPSPGLDTCTSLRFAPRMNQSHMWAIMWAMFCTYQSLNVSIFFAIFLRIFYKIFSNLFWIFLWNFDGIFVKFLTIFPFIFVLSFNVHPIQHISKYISK